MATIQGNVNRYPFDPYGRESTNLVLKERQVITPKNGFDFHYFIPEFAPFFSKDFKLYKEDATGKRTYLVEGVDFNFGMRFIQAANETQQPVYGSISFVNRNYNGNVFIDYRTVGGDWNISKTQILKILAEWLENPIQTTWEQVVNPPIAFPPVDHIHKVEDLTTMKEVYDILKRLLAAAESGTQTGLLQHLADYNNPHKVTKAQVALGNVLDLSILPQGQGANKTDSYYMTPRATVDVFNTQFLPLLNAHVALRNPHNTRPSDIGTLTTLEINALLAEKLGLTEVAYDTTRFGGRTSEQYRSYVLTGTAANAAQFNGMNYMEVVKDILERVKIAGGGSGSIDYNELVEMMKTATAGNAILWDDFTHEQYADWFLLNYRLNAVTLNGKTGEQLVAEAVASKVMDTFNFDGKDANEYANWLLSTFPLNATTLEGVTVADILLLAKQQTVVDSLRVGGYTPEELRDWIANSGLSVDSLNGMTAQEIIDAARLNVNAVTLEGKNVNDIIEMVLLREINAATLNGKTFVEIQAEIDRKIADAGMGAAIDAATLQGRDVAALIAEARLQFDGALDAFTLNGMDFDALKTNVLKGTADDSKKLGGMTADELLSKAWAGPRSFDGYGLDNTSPKMIRLYSFEEITPVANLSFTLKISGLGIFKPEQTDIFYLEVDYTGQPIVGNYGTIPELKGYLSVNGSTKSDIEVVDALMKRFWVGSYVDVTGTNRVALYYYDQLQECQGYFIEMQTVTVDFVNFEQGEDIRIDVPANVNVAINTLSGNYVKASFEYQLNGFIPEFKSMAEMMAFTPIQNTTPVLLKHMSGTDARGGVFDWVTGSTQETLYGFCVADAAGTGRYIRRTQGRVIESDWTNVYTTGTENKADALKEFLQYAANNDYVALLTSPTIRVEKNIHLGAATGKNFAIRTPANKKTTLLATGAAGDYLVSGTRMMLLVFIGGENEQFDITGVTYDLGTLTAADKVTGLYLTCNGKVKRMNLDIKGLNVKYRLLNTVGIGEINTAELRVNTLGTPIDIDTLDVNWLMAVGNLQLIDSFFTAGKFILKALAGTNTKGIMVISKSKIETLSLTGQPTITAYLKDTDIQKQLDVSTIKIIGHNASFVPNNKWVQITEGSYFDSASTMYIDSLADVYKTFYLLSGSLVFKGKVAALAPSASKSGTAVGIANNTIVDIGTAHLKLEGAEFDASFTSLADLLKEGSVTLSGCKVRNKDALPTSSLFNMGVNNNTARLVLENNDWSEVVRNTQFVGMSYVGTGKTLMYVNDSIDIGLVKVGIGNQYDYSAFSTFLGKFLVDAAPNAVNGSALAGSTLEIKNPAHGYPSEYKARATTAGNSSDINGRNATPETQVYYLTKQAGLKVGDTAGRPSGLSIYDRGLQYMNTETAKLEVWNGAAWV